ncbi:putative aminotransferase-like, plant mobile domain-containing protein [Medicago truncatula]|uniref:Putative aminotransferase-like, plant mobile domain-containing protein n=2 Tax=Medicago truncatula TaxID=3880 RepID=A0A396H472_MEDTR|nr:putative aminotransferase-like, plant mobile domain-containing protein [Medicago truncatula]
MMSCKQLGGYATLLQCWIYEYFPTLGNRVENRVACDEPGMGVARAMRWKYPRGNLKVDQIRRMIDDLTPNDVIWCPFDSHRQVIPFDDICLSSGYIRWCSNVVPYLPERCLRQFGYIQYIPRPPPNFNTFNVDVEWNDCHSSANQIIGDAHLTSYPFEVTDTYMEWYYKVSHPHLIRPTEVQHVLVDVPIHRVLSDERPSNSTLAVIVRELEGCARDWGAVPEDPVFKRFFRALDYARDGL